LSESKIKSRWIKVGEINCHYLVGGEGSPLVLIHGSGSCAEDEWKLNLEPLTQHHRIYAPDLIGFGKTDKPRLDYGFQLFSSFFEEFISALNLKKISLLGYSLGGEIALGFTLKYPEQIEKLILVDSTGFTEDITLIGKLISPFFVLKAKLRNDETSLSMARNRKKNIVSFLDKLPEITTPTLIVWGRWDGYLPVKLAYKAHRLIKNSQLYIFKRCWHAPQREKPTEFNRLILNFLKAGR